MKITNVNQDSLSEIREITQKVCDYFCLNIDDVLSDSRNGELVKARHISMYCAMLFANDTERRIGSLFGRDHCTVIHAKKSVLNQADTNAKYRYQLGEIKKILMERTEIMKSYSQEEVFQENDFFI